MQKKVQLKRGSSLSLCLSLSLSISLITAKQINVDIFGIYLPFTRSKLTGRQLKLTSCVWFSSFDVVVVVVVVEVFGVIWDCERLVPSFTHTHISTCYPPPPTLPELFVNLTIFCVLTIQSYVGGLGWRGGGRKGS